MVSTLRTIRVRPGRQSTSGRGVVEGVCESGVDEECRQWGLDEFKARLTTVVSGTVTSEPSQVVSEDELESMPERISEHFDRVRDLLAEETDET